MMNQAPVDRWTVAHLAAGALGFAVALLLEQHPEQNEFTQCVLKGLSNE